ncbi:winged helix-turn-helix domain-containing protein [Catenulispora subtropica]|uniref:Winged helix-turn-helix domain-containing protein n=2 Tax=Catenulispora subtropica TaxID=450798 RepID=A0ABN2RLZ2_9ACTN
MELSLSVDVLHRRSRDLRYRGWREGLDPRWRSAAFPLLGFCGPRYATDMFDDVVTPDPDLTAENLLRFPRDLRRGSLRELVAVRRPTMLVERLAADDPEALRRLAEVVRAYQNSVIRPVWEQVRAVIEADRARRMRALASGGVEQLLSTLHPAVSWRAPVLQVASLSGIDSDVRLKGTGLVLQPAIFAMKHPLFASYWRFEDSPTLVFPACGDGMVLGAREPRSLTRITALLGRGRAATLETIAQQEGLTTGEIARRLGTSAAAASQHTAVLRDAGLIATRRNGSSVLHTITPLGQALLGQ